MSVNTALIRFIYPRRMLGRGIGINALVWGQIYADMVGYLTERNMLEFDMSMNLRMAYCRALRPLGSLLYRRQIRRKSERKGERKGQEKKKKRGREGM